MLVTQAREAREVDIGDIQPAATSSRTPDGRFTAWTPRGTGDTVTHTGGGERSARDFTVLAKRIAPHMRGSGPHTLILFGSHARGDATPLSDVDVIQLVDSQASNYTVKGLSIQVYSLAQLSAMMRAGDLFATHIHNEGVILSDPRGYASEVLGEFRAAASHDYLAPFLEAAYHALKIDKDVFDLNSAGFSRFARWIVRTLLILKQIEKRGEPCFAKSELARVAGSDQILRLLRKNREPSEMWPTFCELRRSVPDLIGAISRLCPSGEHTRFVAVLVERLQAGEPVYFTKVFGTSDPYAR